MHIATNSEIIDISLEVKTAELAKIFSKVVKKGDVVFFHGEIGVGKTTFIEGQTSFNTMLRSIKNLAKMTNELV